MHEFALADAVVTTALAEARRAGMSRLRRIHVTVGELQRIEVELFEFSLTEVIPRQEPALEGVEFQVDTVPARYACRACGTEFGSGDASPEDEAASEAVHMIPELAHAFIRCPGCGGADFEVLSGRGVTLARIEGDGPEDADE
jgi:hydrogenase nickel incorporation protein HypA/HybF